jgi:preprotein translocase subunit SecD
MFESLKVRVLLIVGLVALSVWTITQRGITLGLDLQGGTHLALEVRDPTNALTDAQRADAIDRAITVIRTRVDELGVAEPVIQKVGEARITVELPGATQEEQRRAKDVIQQAAFLQFQIVRPISELEPVIPRLDRTIAQIFGAEAAAPPAPTPGQPATGALEGLFDTPATPAADPAAADTLPAGLAQTDPAAADPAADTLPAGLAQTDTAALARPFSARVVPISQVELAVAVQDVPIVERYLASPEVRALLPRGTEFRWSMDQRGQGQPGAQGFRMLYLLESRPLMTGEYLEDAQAQRDPQLGRPIVTFQLNRTGGRIFAQSTGANIGEQMAIVLDERVYSAPVINGQISTNGQIDLGAGGRIEEARDLALVLRAGALPAPLDIVEERSVGPSLGADSIVKGRTAGLIGIVLVVLMMILYYQFSGVLAVIALSLYAVYTLGLLSGIGAALTFPGIAGFVLSIGMAVDANVLIFERIREELDAGRSTRTAVNEGFRNALPAIIDSNLTTLLTSLILFQFGTGPVRGFAVTLALGLIASMFTALFVTRTFFQLYLERRRGAATISI